MAVSEIFASEIFACEEEARRFLADIEMLMRRGQPDVAANMLDGAMESLHEADHPLAALCERTRADTVEVAGWEALAAHLQRLDRPDRAITAISIDLAAPGHAILDAEPGVAVEPDLETAFYADSSFAFAASSREELLKGYEGKASAWNGRFVDIADGLVVRGLGSLYAAAARLRLRCEAGESDDPADHDAAMLATSFAAVRLHQAVRAAVLDCRLPRPLAVMVDSNGQFPHFDAPVVSVEEYEDLLEAENMEEEDRGGSDLPFASLRLDPPPVPLEELQFADNLDHLSGTALRRRLRANAPVEEPANDGGSRSIFAWFLKRPA